jgi:hypothetical protein
LMLPHNQLRTAFTAKVRNDGIPAQVGRADFEIERWQSPSM